MAPLSVMIVEDDEIAAEIMQKYLIKCRPDAKLEWCWDGFEALVRVREAKPDIIYLDYMMPKLDGLEFINTLDRFDTGHRPYIVVISAYVDKEKRDQFLSAGADEVLLKPVEITEIAKTIDHAAARNQ